MTGKRMGGEEGSGKEGGKEEGEEGRRRREVRSHSISFTPHASNCKDCVTGAPC